MKRSPLRRDTAKARAWINGRAPIARVGRKAKREQSALAVFRTEVRAHADGICEAWWHLNDRQRIDVCGTTSRHTGAGAHHVWPEDRDAGRHDPNRGLWLCKSSHDWAHRHPHAAAQLGLLRPHRGAV